MDLLGCPTDPPVGEGWTLDLSTVSLSVSRHAVCRHGVCGPRPEAGPRTVSERKRERQYLDGIN